MNNIFTAKSRLGYEVICSEDTWYKHIISSHPIMSGKESVVKNTIENPVAIYGSSEYTNRDVYFSDISKNSLYTKVIVSNNDNKFEVVTAFPQKCIGGNINEKAIKYVKSQL